MQYVPFELEMRSFIMVQFIPYIRAFKKKKLINLSLYIISLNIGGSACI